MINDKPHPLPATILNDEAATLAYGARFATCLQTGLNVYLHGNLGAGKTTFVRGVLRGFGYAGKVKSPTYTLVESYELTAEASLVMKGSRLCIHHFDLYRFIDEEEWEAAGFREYFNPQSIGLIEWPEKAERLLPLADIDVRLVILNEARSIQLSANTALGQQCLTNF